MNPRWVTRTTLAAVLALTVAACGGGEDTATTGDGAGTSSGEAAAYDTSKPCEMTVGLQALVLQTSYPRLADGLGYFEDENLEVELLTGEVTSNNVQALIGGSLDAYLGGPEALAANEQGGDLIFVVGAANNSIWDIVAQPSITDLKQLEGKSYGVSSLASISTAAAKAALVKNGVDIKKVNFLPAGGTSKRYAALQAGQVQAATLGIPQNYQAEEDDGFKNFGNTSVDLGAPAINASVLTVSEKWAKANSACLVRFLRAYQRVINDLYDPAKKDQLTEVVATQLKVPAKYAARGIEELFLENEGKDPAVGKEGRIDQESLQNSADAFVEIGALKKKIDATQYVDESYLDQAQQTLEDSPPK
jgi:ABC-type nitrate/sulfonate/bicarbonate transport system substrate-binding protein